MTKALETDHLESQSSDRVRCNLLCQKHKAKQRNELKAKGISPEMAELDKVLHHLLELVAE